MRRTRVTLSSNGEVQKTKYGRPRGSASVQDAGKVGSRGTSSTLTRLLPAKRPSLSCPRSFLPIHSPWSHLYIRVLSGAPTLEASRGILQCPFAQTSTALG